VNFLGAVLQELEAPASRAALIGFSQGGAMTLHGGLSFSEPFGAMGVMSGHLPAAHTLEPPADRGGKQPIVQVHGTEDQTLVIERGREARDWLQKAGFAPEYHEFRMGHQITGESLAVVAEFLSRTLV
jgi:phospholipase/carboxylesterase